MNQISRSSISFNFIGLSVEALDEVKLKAPLLTRFEISSSLLFPCSTASGRGQIRRHRSSRQSVDPFPLVLLLNGGATIHKIIPKESHSAFHKVILEGQIEFLMTFLKYGEMRQLERSTRIVGSRLICMQKPFQICFKIPYHIRI